MLEQQVIDCHSLPVSVCLTHTKDRTTIAIPAIVSLPGDDSRFVKLSSGDLQFLYRQIQKQPSLSEMPASAVTLQFTHIGLNWQPVKEAIQSLQVGSRQTGEYVHLALCADILEEPLQVNDIIRFSKTLVAPSICLDIASFHLVYKPDF